MPYFSLTARDREEMLAVIAQSTRDYAPAADGLTLDELFVDIPQGLREKARAAFDKMGGPLSELETRRLMNSLASRNTNLDNAACFLGAGSYDHYIPAVVPALASRGEFATAYTPYQAEVSQGTLQVIYEFQTLLCQLTAMEMANASLYDGATAVAEAILMAQAATKRNRVLLPRAVSPFYRKVSHAYTQGLPLELDEVEYSDGVTPLSAIEEKLGNDEKNCDVAAVVVQHPNFFGSLEDVKAIGEAAHAKGALLIVVFNPISLGVLQPPGELGADIAVAEGQPLGIAPQFGGPGVGLFCCKQKYARLAPGRLVGMTEDEKGNPGFTLTLQTREQHIRREKATSNICSNQALCALMATVYLSAMGPAGLQDAATQSHHKAHYLAEKLTPAFNAPFFNEFAIRTSRPVAEVNKSLQEKGIIGGFDLGREYSELENVMLLCCTEKRTKEEMDLLAEALAT